MPHLIVTSISGPNAVLGELAEGAAANGWKFHLIGDRKSPEAFVLKGCNHFNIEAQRELPFEYARLCPENSYARKNNIYQALVAGGWLEEAELDLLDAWLGDCRQPGQTPGR